MKGKRNYPEQDWQRIVVKHLSLILPKHIPWTAIEHGKRSRLMAQIMAGLGLKRGWGDLLFCIPPNGRLALLELKAEGGAQSEDQKAVQKLIQDAGGLYAVATAPKLSQVDYALQVWQIPTREASNGVDWPAIREHKRVSDKTLFRPVTSVKR